MYLFPSINSETGDASHIVRLLTSNTGKRVMADGIVRRKYGRWNPVPKEIHKEVGLKYNSGITASELEKEYGFKKTVIYKILEKNGVKRRSGKDYCKQSAGREQEMIALYKTGLSAANTGKQFGVCEATILYVLRKFGVDVRRPGIHDVTKSHLWKGGISKTKDYDIFKQRKYRKIKKNSDPLYKLRTVLRSRIGSLFYRQRNQWKKNRKTCEFLGADWTTVFNHIEAQFQEGMNWKNHGYGKDKWHVDHKIALAKATTQEELEKLFHYTNLQPLWQIENQKKGAR